MPRRKFSMDDYFSQMDEIRERLRPKPMATPTSPIERLRQAMQKGLKLQLPKLPKI